MKWSTLPFSRLLLAFLFGQLANPVRAEPPPPQKPGFPVLDASPCARDADCTYNYKYAMDDGRCCAGTCSPKAVTHATATRVEAYCKKVGYDDTSCPTKKCAAPPPLRCVRNVCELRK